MKMNRLISRNRKSQSGWTLLVILIVIGIIGFIALQQYGWSPDADGNSRLSLEGRIKAAEEAQGFHTELSTGSANNEVDDEDEDEEY